MQLCLIRNILRVKIKILPYLIKAISLQLNPGVQGYIKWYYLKLPTTDQDHLQASRREEAELHQYTKQSWEEGLGAKIHLDFVSSENTFDFIFGHKVKDRNE